MYRQNTNPSTNYFYLDMSSQPIVTGKTKIFVIVNISLINNKNKSACSEEKNRSKSTMRLWIPALR